SGVTVVYTSHYMEEVEALCTRIGIIDHGRLAACDTLPRLLQMLRGLIRCRIAALPDGLRERLARLPYCQLKVVAQLGSPEGASGNSPGRSPGAAAEVELECVDVQGTLVRLIGVLNESQAQLLHIETREPNLERVFLHLTGRALRD